MTKASFKIKRRNAAVGGGGSSLVVTDAAWSSPYTDKAPVFRDAFAVMTPTVDAGDEAIDLHAICGAPYSPLATTITLTGSDLAWFDKASGGKLIFKTATRASVPRDGYLSLTVNASNANGSSETSTLSIWVPATADERFISFKNGSSSNNGAFATPWKYCPKTGDFDGPAASTTGLTFIFEGVGGTGGRHETSLSQSDFSAPPHHGDSTTHKPHRYAFHSWKGQAKFSGAQSISGSWTAASSSDCYGSPNYTNVQKITVGTLIEKWQGVFFGDVAGKLSQYPRPNNLRKNEDPGAAGAGTNNYNDTLGTADGGMKRLIITDNSGDTTPVRFYFAPGGTSSYIQDAKLDVRFNNASVTYNSAGIGMWLKIWGGGNNVSIVKVLGYDVSTHRVTFNAPASSIASFPTPDGYTAYALLGSPYDVQVAGQYALSADGLTIYAHRPNTDQAYVSRLRMGAGIGHQADVAYHQAWFERYAGGERASDSANITGGMGLYSYQGSGPGKTGIKVYGCRFNQNYSEQEDPIGMYCFGELGMDNPVLDRFHHTDNGRGGGSKCPAPMLGRQTGSGPGGYPTMAEVQAHPTGKVRWWFFDEDSVTRTQFYWTRVRGMEFRENVSRNFSTVHGDGYAWYRDNDGQAGVVVSYNDHNLILRDFGDNVLRWRTSSDGDADVDPSVSNSNWYIGCVILASVNVNTGLTLYSGEPGALFQSCVFMQSPNDPANNPAGGPAIDIHQGFANLTLSYCIMNGLITSTTPSNGVPATWTIDHCGRTNAAFPTHDAANGRIQTNTTDLTPHTNTWDGVTVPTAWKSILQAGASAGTVKIGPFANWTV